MTVEDVERELEMLKRRHRIQRFATQYQRQGKTLLECALWKVAKISPFGGMAIPGDHWNRPYLLRTYLTPDGARLHLPRRLKSDADYGVGNGARPYLHYFFRSDGDRDFHNHPWRKSCSLILSGGYTEFRYNPKTRKIDERQFHPGSINIIERGDFHRVKLFDEQVGCWTLFVSIDRMQKSDGTDWGFLDTETGAYTTWADYKKTTEKSEEPCPSSA